jgi:UDP-N-acetyl-D-mannosaminuronic acid dehydrogenase
MFYAIFGHYIRYGDDFGGRVQGEAGMVAEVGDLFTSDVVIVGGCGRVGLPLGIALASRGRSVVLYDINATAVELVNTGTLPFAEEGAAEPLAAAVRDGRLRASVDPASVGRTDTLVIVVGTPVDEHLNPDLGAVPRALERCIDHLRDGQLVVLRSTVHSGVTALTERLLSRHGLDIDVAFCPERIAEGHAMTELFELPQIVSARGERAMQRATDFFRVLTDKIVPLVPEEAELAKLYTNTWRYIKFATANQFWMMANDYGLDFERIRHAIRFEYPRAADIPGPAFAAGPCSSRTRCSLPRSTTTTSCSGTRQCSSTKGYRCTSSPAWKPSTTCRN